MGTARELEALLYSKLDLLVLCHSLAEHEAERCIEIAHAHGHAKVACVTIGLYNDMSCPVATLSNDPSRLLDGVRQMVSTPLSR